MMVRTWSGRVPLVADYRLQPGRHEVRLWCADAEDRTVRFTLVSVWSDMDAIRAYAGFERVPDRVAVHHALVLADPPVSE